MIPFLFSKDRGLGGGDGQGASALFQDDAFPFAANDLIANLGCALPFFVQLFDKETLLETERSGCAMVGGETIEQAAMSISGVAIAITRLLREDFGNLLRVTVSLDHRRLGKLLRVQNSRQRPGVRHV